MKFGLFSSTAHHCTDPGLPAAIARHAGECGTAVLLLYQHPVVLAKRLATIDVLSKGRMSLPIHVGGSSLAAGPGPSLICPGAPVAEIRGAPGIFPMCWPGSRSHARAVNKAVVDPGIPAAGDSGAAKDSGMSAQSGYLRAGQPRPANAPGEADPRLAARQRRAKTGGLRLAQAACAVGLVYAAVSVYWAAGGAWLLSTVGETLGQQGRAGDLGIIVAVWAAAALKFIGAIMPLAAVGVTPWRAAARRRQMRVLAWAEAGILTIYGLVLAGAGWLAQSGVIASTASVDHRALAWHAYLWDPWFLIWGILVTAALVRSRQQHTADRLPLIRGPSSATYGRHEHSA